MARRRSKSEKSQWDFSSPCVAKGSTSPNKVTSLYEPGFIKSPVQFRGVDRTVILGVATVWLRVGRYEGLVVEKKRFFSGASFSCDPLLTISQRRWKSIGRTQQLILAKTQRPQNYSCSSSQLPLKTQTARPIDCNPSSSRFLALFFHFS